MFEAAELGQKLSKERYKSDLVELRSKIIQAQDRLRKADFPMLILFAGVDGAGKGEVVNRLTEWLDPRGVETQVFLTETDEERERPHNWRFWRSLPGKGRISILIGSWYGTVLRDPHLLTEGSQAELDEPIQRIAHFERMLAQDGALILKFWLHISKKEQKKQLLRREKDHTKWRVTKKEWNNHRLYDRYMRAAERAIRGTDTGEAPWFLIEAEDARFRDLTVGQTFLDQLERRLDRPRETARPSLSPVKASAPKGEKPKSILDGVDLENRLDDEAYQDAMSRYQAQLSRLTWKAADQKRSTVAMFEGWDAAGKGGAIRRVTGAIDARLRQVVSIAAPSDEERARHYLWRFWRRLPRDGYVTIFDRSWYGRVLVERVEGFAREEEWMRAYAEINDFEEQLVEHGVRVLKFWIHIGMDEQLRRFKDRQATEYKKHKITDEDWRNREKWNAYEAAINEMVARTSTSEAPWTLVPGNDKKVARVTILKTFCERLDRG